MEDPVVYDKAKYHYEGDYPDDLPQEQAFVHAGMFLGWIIDRGLYSDEFAQESKQQIEAFKRREATDAKVYEWWDGALVDDMLSDEGNPFAEYYFDLEKGMFLEDYEELLAGDLPSLYHVQDTWENYSKIKERIDERYQEWTSRHRRGRGSER